MDLFDKKKIPGCWGRNGEGERDFVFDFESLNCQNLELKRFTPWTPTVCYHTKSTIKKEEILRVEVLF